MATAKTYQVITPCVVLRTDEGAQVYLYEDATFFPEGFDAEQLEQLVAEGYVREASAPAEEKRTARRSGGDS